MVSGVPLRNKYWILFFFLLIVHLSFADYPEIKVLNQSDILFTQLQKDIETYYRAIALDSENIPSLFLFSYNNREGQDLLSISARLNLPYDTIATLNRMENGDEPVNRIIIPNIPGIFVPLDPRSDLEFIMLSWRDERQAKALSVSLETDQGTGLFYFFPGDRFHPVERAYFLRVLFHFPLAAVKGITSSYGKRNNPLTGHPEIHNGVDLAAEIGTEVLAAREGVVTGVGFDNIYGKYIVIDHSNDYQTLYGHLSKVDVDLNLWVNSGMVIGKVGNTGMSTGPHLHFEIRKKGQSRDPVPLLPVKEKDE